MELPLGLRAGHYLKKMQTIEFDFQIWTNTVESELKESCGTNILKSTFAFVMAV
jgi:hypothetical protein